MFLKTEKEKKSVNITIDYIWCSFLCQSAHTHTHTQNIIVRKIRKISTPYANKIKEFHGH